MLGFVASALSILAVGQVHPQSPPASSECKCARAFRTDPDSLDHALLAYTKALAKGDRAAITKHSARFTMGPNRRRTYRPHVEQEQIIDEMIKRPIRAFHFCGHSTSTAESAYPTSRRLHILAGCIQYDEGVRQRVTSVRVLGFRERGQWVFSPIMIPEDLSPTILMGTKPIVPAEAPPPMSLNQRLRNPYIDRVLSRKVTLTNEWLELTPKEPLKVKRDTQEITLFPDPPIKMVTDKGNLIPEDGRAADIEAELIDSNGKKYQSQPGLSETMTGNMKIISRRLDFKDLPRDVTYTKVRIRSTAPYPVKKILWRCYNWWDVHH